MQAAPPQQFKRYVLLDTCVIQMTGSSDKQKSECVRSILVDLSKEYRLVISTFSVFENLHGLWGEKAVVATKLLKSYEWKEVSDKVLVVASMVGGLYREEQVDYMSPGDKIIAATAILEDGLVLTENHRDFPHPFFLTERYIPFTYTTAGKYTKTVDLTLYKPNISLIGNKINELENAK